MCLSCDTREEVDGLVRKAVPAGGSTHGEVRDLGFMYGYGYRDLDECLWELACVDFSKILQT